MRIGTPTGFGEYKVPLTDVYKVLWSGFSADLLGNSPPGRPELQVLKYRKYDFLKEHVKNFREKITNRFMLNMFFLLNFL